MKKMPRPVMRCIDAANRGKKQPEYKRLWSRFVKLDADPNASEKATATAWGKAIIATLREVVRVFNDPTVPEDLKTELAYAVQPLVKTLRAELALREQEVA